MLLLAALLSAPLAQALGLGGILGSGARGERLDAYVPLYLAPGEHATLQGVDVLPDAFVRDDSTPLASIVATLERDGARHYVHVTTDTPLAVERLHFRLRVNTARGAFIGRYALRVPATSAAPSSSSSLSARRARDEARIVARSPAAVAAPAQPRAGDDRYGPVRKGESLWTVARRVSRGNDLQSTMQSLHALNPEAFIGGDMNRLRAGVTLVLPEGSSEEAATRAKTTADDATSMSTTTSVQADAGDALDALLSDTTSVVTTPKIEAPLAAAIVRDDALTRQLAALDAKFAAIRAKYGEQSTTDTNASRATVDTTRAPAPSMTPKIEAQPVVTAAPPQRAAPVAVDERSATRDWSSPALVAGFAALGLLVALPRLQRRFIASRSLTTTADPRAADVDRRAEVARKAENRVRLESEIRGLLQRKRSAPPIAAAPPANAAPPISPFEQTLERLADTQGGDLLEKDRELAIDASIAHGRYAEAEELLREVVSAHPRNVQAKLRLAEIYYIVEKLDGFAEIATELKNRHRAELADEEWQRVVRMGKIIAPDLALFSGPQAVEKRV